ncbi:hypothetical protein GGF43_005023 [Coemansia sp. RSA 2618]|nr:hypothetical protein GGF43_005023 [Coemansia sp. RSA 2618]
MVMTDELELLDKDLDRTYEDSSFESELSEYVDMLHDSSAQSRIAGMIDQLANNVIEDYEKDQVNKLTGSSDDDKDTTGNNNDDNKDSKEETTSGAASTNAGMLLVLVGAVAGAMVAMF